MNQTRITAGCPNPQFLTTGHHWPPLTAPVSVSQTAHNQINIHTHTYTCHINVASTHSASLPDFTSIWHSASDRACLPRQSGPPGIPHSSSSTSSHHKSREYEILADALGHDILRSFKLEPHLASHATHPPSTALLLTIRPSTSGPRPGLLAVCFLSWPV